MKYCKKCKKEYPENKKFCSDCGGKLVNLVETKLEKIPFHKRQISMKGPIILLVIFFTILIILGFVANFFFSTSSSPSSLIGTQSKSDILDEYNNYIPLFNSDDEKMVNLYNNWVDTLNNAIKDNQLTTSEVNQMKTAIESYAYEYNIVKQHLSNFKNFIVANENYLKTQTTVDTFQMKTKIDDHAARLENNINYMTTKTQDLINAYQAQQDALSNILKILIGLA